MPTENLFSRLARNSFRVVVGSQFLNVQMGGAEKYAKEVCSLLERDHEMELSYISSDVAVPGGVSKACLHFMSTGVHPAWGRELYHILIRARPDVVYVHHTVPGLTDLLIRAAARLEIPTVLMYHSDVTGPGLIKRTIGVLYHHLIGRASLSRDVTLFLSVPWHMRMLHPISMC